MLLPEALHTNILWVFYNSILKGFLSASVLQLYLMWNCSYFLCTGVHFVPTPSLLITNHHFLTTLYSFFVSVPRLSFQLLLLPWPCTPTEGVVVHCNKCLNSLFKTFRLYIRPIILISCTQLINQQLIFGQPSVSMPQFSSLCPVFCSLCISSTFRMNTLGSVYNLPTYLFTLINVSCIHVWNISFCYGTIEKWLFFA